ncbi:MAG: RNA polymerase sigma factor [Solirubrobacterales bacterium]
MTAADTNRAIDAIWRIESAKVIAAVARATGDLGLAEDAAQEACIAAIESWPQNGVPDRPGAWLTATAKNRAIDTLRRRSTLESKQEAIEHEAKMDFDPSDDDLAAALNEDIDDDLLRLIFTTCHPVLSTDSRVALTLRLLGGLTTGEIARAFLAKESAVGQRISRAKRTLAEANVPFEVPGTDDIGPRLKSVLEVIYLIFNEGYAATAGQDWLRPELCADAMRLGRILAGLVPDEPETHGLVALMELQASRVRARTDKRGEPILLLDQDRARWDWLLIEHGLNELRRAQALGGGLLPYTLQAALAACHAEARTPEATNWERIVALYDALAQLNPSPVIELNRAVAVGMAYGPDAGLELVDRLLGEKSLKSYHLLPSVRGNLLEKLGRLDEARTEYELAASLTQNERERKLLYERAAALD